MVLLSLANLIQPALVSRPITQWAAACPRLQSPALPPPQKPTKDRPVLWQIYQGRI